MLTLAHGSYVDVSVSVDSTPVIQNAGLGASRKSGWRGRVRGRSGVR